jgi:hypothetical protein
MTHITDDLGPNPAGHHTEHLYEKSQFHTASTETGSVVAGQYLWNLMFSDPLSCYEMMKKKSISFEFFIHSF